MLNSTQFHSLKTRWARHNEYEPTCSCEALINFTRTFSPDKPCRALHTDQMRQVLWEPEPCVWMVLVAKRAKVPNRDSDSYGEDDLSSQVLFYSTHTVAYMISFI